MPGFDRDPRVRRRSAASVLLCECGGQVADPPPAHCPHCGAEIAAIRQSLLSRFAPWLIVLLMFGVLLAFVALIRWLV